MSEKYKVIFNTLLGEKKLSRFNKERDFIIDGAYKKNITKKCKYDFNNNYHIIIIFNKYKDFTSELAIGVNSQDDIDLIKQFIKYDDIVMFVYENYKRK